MSTNVTSIIRDPDDLGKAYENDRRIGDDRRLNGEVLTQLVVDMKNQKWTAMMIFALVKSVIYKVYVLECKGNISAAAIMLGINRSTLGKWLPKS